MLDRGQEAELAHRAACGCEESRRKLVECNLSFVVRIAKEYRNKGVPFEDLLNEGNVGLLEAVRRYDRTRGTRFITYASWWIRKAILEALMKNSRIVRLPYYQIQRRRRMKDKQEDGHEALPPTIHVHSLDETVGDDDRTLAERLPDLRVTNPEETALLAESTVEVRHALGVLTAQERRIVEARYGLHGHPCRSLHEVGSDFGLSRERIRQIEVRAVGRLRRALRLRGRPRRFASIPASYRGEGREAPSAA